MYHSVTFGTKNSYSDWHLVPDGRPVIAMPEPRTVTVEVPGSNGILDLSESLTKYPLYSNRTGSLKFHVLNDIEDWKDLYQRIAGYLHGKVREMYLEDDPDYYYKGRFSVTWTSNNDGSGSDVEIGYDLEPYKYYVKNSIEENTRLYKNITLSGTTKTLYLGTEWSIGEVPVVPEFVVSNVSGSGLTITVVNNELEINKSIRITSNGTKKYYDVVLSNISGANTCNISINGSGKVNIVFRRMAL